MCSNPTVAVQPADSRMVVYDFVETAHRLWIKGQHFTVGKLLGPCYEPEAWRHAAMAINR
jgi:phosphatidylserine decarboxylase